MYQHILLPTDGSDLSAAAIKSALQLAKLLGARVTGLCVVVEPLVAGGLGEVMIGHDHAVQAADSYLAALAGEARSQGVPHECFQVKGTSIAEEIVKAATTRGCDLICMASQGQHGLAGLLFGSSETVEVLNLARSRCWPIADPPSTSHEAGEMSRMNRKAIATVCMSGTLDDKLAAAAGSTTAARAVRSGTGCSGAERKSLMRVDNRS